MTVSGDAKAFNGVISKWDVSSVNDMTAMFGGAKAFNRDISKWDVTNTTSGMFSGRISFSSGIARWDETSVVDVIGMFSQAHAVALRHSRTW